MRRIKIKTEWGTVVEVAARMSGGCYLDLDTSTHRASAVLSEPMARRLAKALLTFADGASKPKRKGRA